MEASDIDLKISLSFFYDYMNTNDYEIELKEMCTLATQELNKNIK